MKYALILFAFLFVGCEPTIVEIQPKEQAYVAGTAVRYKFNGEPGVIESVHKGNDTIEAFVPPEGKLGYERTWYHSYIVKYKDGYGRLVYDYSVRHNEIEPQEKK